MRKIICRSAGLRLGIVALTFISVPAPAQVVGPWAVEKSMFSSNMCLAKHEGVSGMKYERGPQGFSSRFSIIYPEKSLEGDNVSVQVDLDGGSFSTLADGDVGVVLKIDDLELQFALENSRSIRVRRGGETVFQRSLDDMSKALPALRRCAELRSRSE